MSTPPERWRAAAGRLALAAAAPLIPVRLPSMPAAPQRPDSVVRDTIAAVFRHREYARSVRESLWSRFLRWLGGLLRRLFADAGDHPAGRRVAELLIIALAVLVVARIAWGAWQAAEGRVTQRRHRSGRSAAAGDPWAIAREHAAADRYVDAAHALYQALLAALADRERVRLHPSKTAGDYVRDLRGLRSPLLPTFREFTRAYEVVAYGTGECDRARYERLLALASATLGSEAPGARRAAPAAARGAA